VIVIRGGGVKGTSYSAPQVAGTASLLWAAFPSLTQFDLRNIMNHTATYKGAATKYGHGLLNVYECFTEVLVPTTMPETPQNLSVSIISNRANLSWTGVPGISKYYVYRSNSSDGRYGFEIVAEVNNATSWIDYSYRAPSNPGTILSKYFYRITAVKSGGEESIMSNEVEVGIDYLFKPAESPATVYNYNLDNNYPNPFNPTTIINYEIANDSDVRIKVMDLLGREVAEIVNERKQAGIYNVKFDSGKLASGIYFYTIEAGSYKASKKMMLLR
jgi:hypothetical protein